MEFEGKALRKSIFVLGHDHYFCCYSYVITSLGLFAGAFHVSFLYVVTLPHYFLSQVPESGLCSAVRV